jgi:MFS family permease
VGLIAVAVFINYIDRGNLATAAPLIKSELHLTTLQIGLLTSAFFWTYTPCQLLGSWVADRLGGYRTLALGFAVWSLATALTSIAGGLATLFVLRVLLGIGESVAFPCLSKLFAEHVPPEELGVANGCMVSGTMFGPAFGMLAGGLVLATLGWRAMFLCFGVVAMLWLIPWLRFTGARASPGRRSSFQAGRAPPPPPYREILGRRAFWGTTLGHFAVVFAQYFLLSWLPLWLVQQHGYSIPQMARLGAAVYCAAGASTMFFGWLVDRLIAGGVSITTARKAVSVIGHVGAALGLAGCVFAQGAGVIVCLFASASCLMMVSLWPITQTLAGPRAAARWVGIQNALANTAGIVGPVITGWIVDTTKSFDAAFLIAAAVALAGAVGWVFLVRRVEPLVWVSA